MTQPLTAQQDHFAVLLVQLGSQAEAYRTAYPNFAGRNASEYGRRLLKHKGVRARIEAIAGVPLDVMLERIRMSAKGQRTKRADCERRSRQAFRSPPSGDAIMALASVVVCPSVPAAHRVKTIEVLQLQLAELAAAVRVSERSDQGS